MSKFPHYWTSKFNCNNVKGLETKITFDVKIIEFATKIKKPIKKLK